MINVKEEFHRARWVHSTHEFIRKTSGTKITRSLPGKKPDGHWCSFGDIFKDTGETAWCLATSKQFGLCGVLDIRAETGRGEVGTRSQKSKRHRRNAEEFGLNF